MEERLKNIEAKLDAMQITLNKVAVQKEQISTLTRELNELSKKWNDFVRPSGELSKIARHQASCPRGQIRFLWWLVIPQGLTLIGMAVAVIAIST